jgi:hypothetical protein
MAIIPHTVTAGGRTFKIYGNTNELTEFFDGIEADAESPSTTSTATVSAHSYRRYPGGPLISRASHPRTRLVNSGKAGSNATPGRSFYIERLTGIPPFAKKEVKSFTTTGPFFALKAYATANAAGDFTLRSSGGRSHEIDTTP